jgi:hypothetical protein
MLQGYKDEVDTLKEALQIAAMDVIGVVVREDAEQEDEDVQEQEQDESHHQGRLEDTFVDQEGDEFFDGQHE